MGYGILGRIFPILSPFHFVLWSLSGWEFCDTFIAEGPTCKGIGIGGVTIARKEELLGIKADGQKLVHVLQLVVRTNDNLLSLETTNTISHVKTS